MALIEQANIIDKINPQNLFRQRTLSIADDLQTLSFNVYSSQHLISTTNQTRYQRSDTLILPSIHKDENRYQRKTKRPFYLTSIYHSNISNSTKNALPVLTVHRKAPELSTIIRNDTVGNMQRQHTPPPTPSDIECERLSIELNRTRQSALQSSTDNDGYVPYRLPALNQSSKQRRKETAVPPKRIKSILTNYYQRLYPKY
jgi:hypothetical protein